MRIGWFKLYRPLEDSEFWLAEPFTKGQAWVDMLLMTNYERGTVTIRGIDVTLDPGQLLAGEEYLAKRWMWSRGKVRRFMKMLETRQQIEQQKSNVITVATILNWNHYQGNGTADSTASSTTNGQQTDTLKKNKKEKNNNMTYTEEFCRLWKSYPKKIGKGAAFKAWELVKSRPPVEELITAVETQSKSDQWKKDGGQYIPHPATWLNQRRWEDEPPTVSQDHSLHEAPTENELLGIDP